MKYNARRSDSRDDGKRDRRMVQNVTMRQLHIKYMKNKKRNYLNKQLESEPVSIVFIEEIMSFQRNYCATIGHD